MDTGIDTHRFLKKLNFSIILVTRISRSKNRNMIRRGNIPLSVMDVKRDLHAVLIIKMSDIFYITNGGKKRGYYLSDNDILVPCFEFTNFASSRCIRIFGTRLGENIAENYWYWGTSNLSFGRYCAKYFYSKLTQIVVALIILITKLFTNVKNYWQKC